MQKTLSRSSFGGLLREFRLAAGLSQEALAERAALSAEGISALERGVNKAPQRETLTLLVGALELGPHQREAIEAAVARPSRPRAPAARAIKGHNLPRVPSPLLGREQELADLEQLVKSSPVLTLIGAGGVGKTRLAIEAGYAALQESRDGAWFVDLATIRDSDSVTTTLAETLGVRERSEQTLLDAIVERLEQKKALLILDNCEHVVASAATAAERIASDCPNVRVLATSRQPLQIAAEHSYRVASLSLSASVALFIENAKRADAAFSVEAEEMTIIERICSRLDGIALAIELAAARVRLLSLTQIEELLSERFVVLAGAGRPSRHQTMRAVLDWSFDLLPHEERRLFARVGIFPADFSLEAAFAVCWEGGMDSRLLDILSSLVDKSLLISERRGKVRRFRLLETMRAYAMEKLGDEITELSKKHAEHYLRVIEAMDSRSPSWQDAIETEFDNVRRALEWSIDDWGDPALGVRLLVAVRPYLWLRGLGGEYTRRAERALAGPMALPVPLQAAALETLVALRSELLTSHDLLDASSQAFSLYEKLDDQAGMARALRQRGRVYLRLGMHAQAETDLGRALELGKKLGDEWELIRTLAAVAAAFQVMGRSEESRKTKLEVVEMARRAEDEQMVQAGLLNLAETEFALGEIESAVGRLEEVLATKMARKNVRFRAHAQSNVAAYLLALNRDVEARAMARAAIFDAREAGDRGIFACALGHIATMLSRGDPRTAAKLLGYVEIVFAGQYRREGTELYTHDLLMKTLHEAFSEAEIAELARDGAALSELQAVHIATKHPHKPK